jgi:hypothetical protein
MVCLHGKKRNSIAKASWMQLDENDAACGISVVDGNRIVSGFPKGRPLMNRDGGAEVAEGLQNHCQSGTDLILEMLED